MELGIAAIGIASVALCAMPFVITNRSRKRKEKQMMASLTEVASKHNCQITEYEIFGHYGIGVDTQKKFVFFISKSGEVLNQQYANLATIKTCEITNIGKSYAKKEKITARLLLTLFSKKINEPDTVFEFYDAEINFQLSGEFQSIEKWNKTIKNLLKSNKV
ncbi:hypothetical protein [Maribacter hydrothermalis]|uniref:Uncharacterized protein n=1 Tax=Maribacter hydrothermalis TaxID=1836467 RepID=A0A1B7ZC99_9FLAO|nr:hypothetical protein [Maribacter hydrothermalis]APQ15976.1 hypothetical protein BTR34_00855 [Maribacter hydrothermalis]OBR40393.1 hypothetical protein A9200_16060 [Maribacter hydrothermalis]